MLWTSAVVFTLLSATPQPPRAAALSKRPPLAGIATWRGSALNFQPPLPEGWKITAATYEQTVYLGVKWATKGAGPARVTLHFAGTGVASSGALYPGPPPDADRTSSPSKGVRWAVRGNSAELELSRVGLPSFPIRGTLTAELCVSPPAGELSLHCANVRLSPSLRRGIPGAPAKVIALEARTQGWLGSDSAGEVIWASTGSLASFAEESLTGLVAADALSASSLGLFVAPNLRAPGGMPLMAVLSGKDPFSDKTCSEGHQVRMTLWAIKDNQAFKVLDWPVASCELGRATSIVNEEDQSLVIAYAGGTLVSFTWSVDHFERTELG